jgi:Thymidylate synthase
MTGPAVAAQPLTFVPLYFADRLRIVNPAGDVGLITLWSPVRTVERKLRTLDPELLSESRSRIAVIANLYGEGMYAMFCNLLYNPQIRHLVAVGEQVGLPTAAEIEGLLARGLEDVELMGRPMRRVPGTARFFPADAAFDVDRLRRQLSFRYLARLSDARFGDSLRSHLGGLARAAQPRAERVRVDVDVGLPADYAYLPSNPLGHHVVRPSPLQAWRELVVRVMRFGRPTELADGERLALLDVKAVVTAPVEDPAAALAEHGFDLARLHDYQRGMLDPALPEGVAYAYGHRLRRWFETDALQTVVSLLRDDPATRRAYISLWDTGHDLPGTLPPPCLATLWFQRLDERLTLTATYRAHNLLTGWLQNVYGLMAVLRHVAAGAGLEPGSITVLSHFLGVDPRSPRLAIAREIERSWKHDDEVDGDGKVRLREDPHGYFAVSADRERGLIVAEHRYRGALIKRYEAERAVSIENEVAADMAVSLVSHALWLGRELTRKEQQLRAGG